MEGLLLTGEREIQRPNQKRSLEYLVASQMEVVSRFMRANPDATEAPAQITGFLRLYGSLYAPYLQREPISRLPQLNAKQTGYMEMLGPRLMERDKILQYNSGLKADEAQAPIPAQLEVEIGEIGTALGLELIAPTRKIDRPFREMVFKYYPLNRKSSSYYGRILQAMKATIDEDPDQVRIGPFAMRHDENPYSLRTDRHGGTGILRASGISTPLPAAI